WRSSRVSATVNGVNSPAAGSAVCAKKPGEKGSVVGQGPPAPSQSTAKDEDGVASGVSPGPADHGVKSLLVVAGPHVRGLASGALGPFWTVSFRSLNGSCGLSRKLVVSWPVLGSTDTVPASLTVTPAP